MVENIVRHLIQVNKNLIGNVVKIILMKKKGHRANMYV